jgi:hypothetical protein
VKDLPRFERLGVRDRPDEFRRPLPGTLLALVAEAAAEHLALAERYDEARGRVTLLRDELQKAQKADRARERQALATGKPVPAAKARRSAKR